LAFDPAQPGHYFSFGTGISYFHTSTLSCTADTQPEITYAHLKGPREPQLPAIATLVLASVAARLGLSSEANNEESLNSISWLWQLGHSGACSSSEPEEVISKCLPHVRQRYSYLRMETSD
jgi:hypothetical protein